MTWGSSAVRCTRLEDRPLVTGRGRFAADVFFPHMLHMRVVRSGHAHGRIVSVDTSAALALPGVAAVWTFDDVADIPPIDFRLTKLEGLTPYRQTILAQKRVRYVGEPVAAVFATDAYLAEDAADLVTVEVEELPAIVDARSALGEFDDNRSTEPAIVEKSYGDIAGAFDGAHAVVELDLTIGRHSGVPMETRGAIARYDASRDVLEMHGAAKVPHWNRDNIARMLRPSALDGASVRGPCRRRLRHPRRALPRGCAGLRRGVAARPAGEVDRGPARASDRRQSFAPAAPQGARRGRRAAAAFSASTTSSFMTRGHMCAPTRPPCPISPPPCCRGPTGCRIIAPSATSGSPTRRRAAPTGRQAATRARSCASG